MTLKHPIRLHLTDIYLLFHILWPHAANTWGFFPKWFSLIQIISNCCAKKNCTMFAFKNSLPCLTHIHIQGDYFPRLSFLFISVPFCFFSSTLAHRNRKDIWQKNKISHHKTTQLSILPSREENRIYCGFTECQEHNIHNRILMPWNIHGVVKIIKALGSDFQFCC